MKCKSLLKVLDPDIFIRLQVGDQIVAEEMIYKLERYNGNYGEYLDKKVKRVYSVDTDIIRIVLVD